MSTKRKFASQAEGDLLDRLRAIARAQGRHFQAVLEDALREYLEQHDPDKPRATVLAHFQASAERNRRLGELLSR